MSTFWDLIIATAFAALLATAITLLVVQIAINEEPSPALSATFETTGSEEELIEWVQKYIVKWGNLCENRDFNAPNCEMFNNLRRK